MYYYLMTKYLFFDLDGTLTDPSEGITNCIAYALEKLGVKCPPHRELTKYIGPPLYQSFMEMLGTDEKSAGENAVKIYRERFSTVGLLENSPYEGILDTLERLKNGYKMFVCTSKPQIFAEQILCHFAMDKYFIRTYGSSLDGTHVEKDSLMAHLIRTENLNPSECVMIGDRIYDIDGAIKNGVRPFGVGYGFGNDEELKMAEKIFDTPQDIAEHFCKY